MQIITNRKIKIGILGCGRISVKHIEAILKLNKDLELVAVCDIDLQKIKKSFLNKSVRLFSSIEDMLKLKLDLISICTPSGLHAEHSLICSQYNTNVITEKPMAIKLLDAKKMIDTFERKQLYLFVVLQNRFNPTLKKLKQAIVQNRFGKIYFSHINVFWNRSQDYYDMDEWRGTKSLDGGSLMNQASHYVDLLYWLFGDINELNCFSGTLGRKIECEDTSSINFRFKNGVMASLNVTTLTYNQNFEGSITIIGQKGTVKISGKAVNKIQHWEFENKLIDDDKIFETNYNIKNIYGNGHINYYENVISALRGKNKPEIDGKEGLKSLEIIEMSYRSHENNTNVKKEN